MPKEWLDLIKKFKAQGKSNPYGLATSIYQKKHGHNPQADEEFLAFESMRNRLIILSLERKANEQSSLSKWWTEIPLEVRQKALLLARTNTQDPNTSFEDLFPEDVVQLGKFYRDVIMNSNEFDASNQIATQNLVTPKGSPDYIEYFCGEEDFRSNDPEEAEKHEASSGHKIFSRYHYNGESFASEEDVNVRRITKANLEDVIAWWKTLNQSQRQHSVDPQQIYDWSLGLSQKEWKNSNDDERIEVIRGFGFRHEDKDVSDIIGFDANPEDEEKWWGLFNSSQRQHVIDPHKQFWWSLQLAETTFNDLTEDEKSIVVNTYKYRHGEGEDSKKAKESVEDESSFGWWDSSTPEDRMEKLGVIPEIANKTWRELTPEQQIKLRQVILSIQSDYAKDVKEIQEFSKFMKKDWQFNFGGANQPNKLLEHPDSCVWKSMGGYPVCIRPGESPADAFKRLKKRMDPIYTPPQMVDPAQYGL